VEIRLNKMNIIKRTPLILSLALFAVLLIIAFILDETSTGDAGDSISHYLFSRYAFEYPQFFFDHWAKPLFVLLSAPFSQFGFKGIVIFNIICATLTALFTYYTARSLKIKYPLLVYLFIFFSTLYFKLIFSGLTEYLFGLFLIVGIFLFQNKKYIPALIIVSFLPLIRSEGLLIIFVFAGFCLINKKIKLLPYLITGQLIYTLAGAWYHKDLLWVINEIPYANLGSPYGKGKLLDFLHRLNYVIEKPIYLLLAIGTLSLIFSFFKTGLKKIKTVSIFLVFGSFATYFIAHTVFWWQGIFNSMGLPRVLIAVVPVIAIISLIGLQSITDWFKNSIIRISIIGGFVIAILVYPFIYRPEGVVFDKKLFTIEENKLIQEEVVPYIKEKYPDYSNSRLYFSHPYLGLALDVDYFNSDSRREIQHIQVDTLAFDGLVIWDDWFSVIEGGISLEHLKNKRGLELKKKFHRQEKDRTIQYVIFQNKI